MKPLKEFNRLLMKTLAILLIYFSGVTSPNSTSAQTIDGTWNTTMNTVDGIVEIVYQFQTNEENINGSVFTPNGVFLVEQGKINGNTISFIIKYGEIIVYHTGYYLRGQLLISTSYQGNSGQITLNRVID